MQLLNILSRTIWVAFSNAQYPSRILSTFKNRIELYPHPPQCILSYPIFVDIMQIESQGEIYFTPQQSELISSVIVANGAVIARGPSLQERAPENWISALREMAEKLGKVKANEVSSYAAEGQTSLFMIPPMKW